jgi:ferredoxin
MVLSIDEDSCIGCGLCVNMAPTIFAIKNNKAIIIDDNISSDLEELAQEAQDTCPVEAIVIS